MTLTCLCYASQSVTRAYSVTCFCEAYVFEATCIPQKQKKIAISIKKGLLILMSQHLVNILWKLVMPFCLLVGLQCQFAAITNGKN